MATRRKGSASTNRKAGEIRRSQLITTYGPGAMVDLKDDAALIQVVDGWRGIDYQEENDRLHDPRLQELINGVLRQLDSRPQLDPAQPFVSPPVPSDEHAAPNQSKVGIAATTFPLWFVCQACNQLHRAESMRQKSGQNLHTCSRGEERSGRSVPVRFVVACKSGHLDEFPWDFFVHSAGGERSACRSGRLLLKDESADLSTARVVCEDCKESRSLMEAFANDKALGLCRGRRPWIPGYLKAPHITCDEPARPLVRTASNSWYSVIASALQLEREELSTQQVLEGIHLDDDAIAAYRSLGPDAETAWGFFKATRKDLVEKFAEEPLKHAFFAAIKGEETRTAPEGIRAPEYRTLIKAPAFAPGWVEGTRARDDAPRMIAHTLTTSPHGLDRVVRVDLLQELRAQIGFTRMHPCPPLDETSWAAAPEGLQLAFEQTPRLPAVLNRGEGIFFSLDEARLADWENGTHVTNRVAELNEGDPQNERPARFYLLHTLSHLLMESLGTYCGYASTALRERLYWSRPTEEFMAGVLIMTATPGTDGTLGGLADQAKSLSMHLNRVRERALLCSNDPVCSTHPHTNSSGVKASAHAQRTFEGAACYACCYVAEPSCEAFNRYLDRALVFPVIGQAATLAYFRADEGF
jgi:hypothetical protein